MVILIGLRKCSAVEPVVIRPCCVGTGGTCKILTESQCVFMDGIYHHDKQLCSEVSCLQSTCKTFIKGSELATKSDAPNQPENPNQWYRFIVPIFTHAGLIHYVLCMMVQWTLGCQIERAAGWLRVLLIYFLSGFGGYGFRLLFTYGLND